MVVKYSFSACLSLKILLNQGLNCCFEGTVTRYLQALSSLMRHVKAASCFVWDDLS